MTSRSFPVRIAAFSAASLIAATTAQSASVFADNFSTATVRGSASDGFGAGTVASVGNYVTTGGGSFSIDADATTGPAEGSPAVADNALNFAPGAAVRGFITEFAAQDLTTTGDMLTLTFDFRFTTAPTATVSDVNGLRFGLFTSQGTTAVNNSSNVDDNDRGYRGGFVVNGDVTGNTSVLGYESGANGSVLSGSDFGQTATGTTVFTAFGTDSQTISLSLLRTDTGLTLTSSLNGTQIQTRDFADTAPGFRTSFNELGIGNGSPTQAYRIDNIDVDFIPEPSSAFLLGAAGVLGLVRRRRN